MTPFYKAIKGTETAKELETELDNLIVEIYDARNWEKGFTKEMADLAAKPVRAFIKKLTIQPDMQPRNQNECE